MQKLCISNCFFASRTAKPACRTPSSVMQCERHHYGLSECLESHPRNGTRRRCGTWKLEGCVQASCGISGSFSAERFIVGLCTCVARLSVWARSFDSHGCTCCLCPGFFVFLSFSLSLSLALLRFLPPSLFPWAILSLSLSLFLFLFLSLIFVCLSINHSGYLSIYLSAYLSILYPQHVPTGMVCLHAPAIATATCTIILLQLVEVPCFMPLLS